ncbi:hypothetical protein [Flagellimonas onchidii]|uniref:hypothetical protein n=1 Tax=Flagellimonas onchidii TaxID=2562684 RepID=UPI0010A6AA77|nr:hypothetical protein [Allomuricauda onchidii]
MNTKRIILLAVVLLSILSCGKKSSDLEIENSKAIIEWYYGDGFKSIQSELSDDNNITPRTADSKKALEKIYRIKMNLDEQWQFQTQDFKISHVSETQSLTKIITTFIFKEQLTFYEEVFYYNGFELPIPIPVESKLWSTAYSKETKKAFWNNDYEYPLQ